ncbi:MAG: hypothetical protein ABIQ19_12455 [Sphingomonas sp.]
MRMMVFSKATSDRDSGRPSAIFKSMTNALTMIVFGLICTVSPSLAVQSSAAASAAPSSSMAPTSAYLMDRTQEIALARSAAPAPISNDATILVLTRTGYETAVQGSNGFVCWVGRGFSGAPDWNERWNPKIRAAGCYNPQAARSMTPIAKLRTAMTLAGRPDTEIIDRIKLALRTKEIPPLEAGAMCYMMSKDAYLTNAGSHGMAHIMFFIPSQNGDSWGANLPGAPVFGGSYWFFLPEHKAEAASLPPVTVLLIGVGT